MEDDSIIHYWKSIQKESNETIGKLLGLSLVLHNSAEFSDIARFISKIRKNEPSKVLYFSMTTSYNHIKDEIKVQANHNKNYQIIDMVSGFLLEIQDNVDCLFRKPPKNFAEMQMMMMTNIQRTKPDIVCVDSLSQFMNFTQPSDQDLQKLYQFLGSLKQRFMGTSVKNILLFYDEKHGHIKKLPLIFTDMIMKIEVIRPSSKIIKTY